MYKKTPCSVCDNRITWEEQRREFGRLLKGGFSRNQAKAVMPRCCDCVSTLLRRARAVTHHGDGDALVTHFLNEGTNPNLLIMTPVRFQGKCVTSVTASPRNRPSRVTTDNLIGPPP